MYNQCYLTPRLERVSSVADLADFLRKKETTRKARILIKSATALRHIDNYGNPPEKHRPCKAKCKVNYRTSALPSPNVRKLVK